MNCLRYYHYVQGGSYTCRIQRDTCSLYSMLCYGSVVICKEVRLQFL